MALGLRSPITIPPRNVMIVVLPDGGGIHEFQVNRIRKSGMVVYFLAVMDLDEQMAVRIIHSINGGTVYKHHAQNACTRIFHGWQLKSSATITGAVNYASVIMLEQVQPFSLRSCTATAGLPRQMVNGFRSVVATDPMVSTAWLPTHTPGPTKLPAPIHAPVSTRIGFTMRSNDGDL